MDLDVLEYEDPSLPDFSLIFLLLNGGEYPPPDFWRRVDNNPQLVYDLEDIIPYHINLYPKLKSLDYNVLTDILYHMSSCQYFAHAAYTKIVCL